VVVAGCEMTVGPSEDADFNLVTVGFESREEGSRVTDEFGGDNGSYGLTSEGKTEGDLEFLSGRGAGGVGLVWMNAKDGSVEASLVPNGVRKVGIRGSRDVILHASSSLQVEASVAKGEDVRRGDTDGAGIVIVEGDETILGFVEFGESGVKS